MLTVTNQQLAFFTTVAIFRLACRRQCVLCINRVIELIGSVDHKQHPVFVFIAAGMDEI